MPGLKERATTLLDILDGARFLFAERPLVPDEKAAGILAGDGARHLAALVPLLEQVEDWTVESVESVVRDYTKDTGAKLGQVAQPIRAALTGTTQSPGVFDVMAVLGKHECIARMADKAAD